jgi:hypothetical protein
MWIVGSNMLLWSQKMGKSSHGVKNLEGALAMGREKIVFIPV